MPRAQEVFPTNGHGKTTSWSGGGRSGREREIVILGEMNLQGSEVDVELEARGDGSCRPRT
ncbi:hypothetical protein H634G_11394 [Metarhizium anisopliae BRIP 53293]|uniref:Uncharacterized protein n=1 Tax=Metarhizium anisopliae BRIP 53293 TaxID=1291518 RepID=A0A0D9NHA8_METAN|nr:hypothetical protein H634G_11394 [Metarhizium anisopliae BRIP 53293]